MIIKALFHLQSNIQSKVSTFANLKVIRVNLVNIQTKTIIALFKYQWTPVKFKALILNLRSAKVKLCKLVQSNCQCN